MSDQAIVTLLLALVLYSCPGCGPCHEGTSSGAL
jgi:hypothetical protein